jgi:hypothetical protein
MLKGSIIGAVAGILILLIGIQWLPYGRDHANPPVQSEPPWNSPQTRELAVRACFDCHSNETVWPWYSNVAPLSWLIQQDVVQGRRRLNFSDWNRTEREGTREMARVIQRGEMPPSYYTLLHPSAKLSPQETQALINGLSASLAQR